MEIWRGRVLWRVYIHPHPHPHPHIQLKKLGISHTHTQSIREFPVKTETDSDNTHGDGFIWHLYLRKTIFLKKRIVPAERTNKIG